MLFKLTVLALLGFVACQQSPPPEPLGECPPTNDVLTHLPDKNGCEYFFVCHNGVPLLMPRCRTGHVWDGTRCREGTCADVATPPPSDTTVTLEVTTPVNPDDTTLPETPATAPPSLPTAPIIPPTAPEV